MKTEDLVRYLRLISKEIQDMCEDKVLKDAIEEYFTNQIMDLESIENGK